MSTIGLERRGRGTGHGPGGRPHRWSARAAIAAAAAVTLGGCAGPPTAGGRLAESDVPAAGDDPGAARLAAAHVALEHKQRKLRERGPKALDQPQAAAEFFARQRLGPGQTEYPVAHLRRTLTAIEAREAALAADQAVPGAATGAAAPAWSWIGPGNVGGRTRSIVFAPGDPDTMYAGGVSGGVWRSSDGGASWSVTDDLMLNLAVTTIAIDPNDANVLYAGTGEGFATGANGTYTRGLGIFKSTDAGETWAQLDGTVTGVPAGAFHYVNKIVISPNDSSRVYAATRFGVWRSLDAGQTWAVVLGNPTYLAAPFSSNGSAVGCTDLVVRADRDPDVLFAAFGSFEQDGFFRSDDGGDTWITYTTGVNQGRMTIALAPSDNDVMYILMADNGAGGPTGHLVEVFRSLDGGNSFEGRVDFAHPMGPWLLSNLILATGCLEGSTYSQGWHDNIIAVDPVDPDIVWVGGVDLFRSEDGGQSWGLAGYWIYYLMDPPPPDYVHPDHHVIAFHPGFDGAANQTMFVGNDGGMYRTDNARASTTQEDCPLPGEDPPPAIVWSSANSNYGVTQFYHGAAGRDADVFVGGAQDNGTSRGLGTSSPNAWKLIFGGDGGYAAIDPTDARTMYVTYHVFPSIQKSVDGGDTFVEATTGITDTDGLFITPLAMDRSDPQTLWTGGRRPWRTTDGAAAWTPGGPDLAGPDRISAIGIAPSDPAVVYLGFDNGYVARTTNGLDASPTWSVFVNGLHGAWVSSIAVDPDDPDVAYLTYSTFGVPHVLRTTNGGASWASIDGIEAQGVPDIPAHWVAVRPCDAGQLLVGTELGVFRSDDGGGTWIPFNDGLAHTVVETLDFTTHHTLVAFTHGRGAFLIGLAPCPSCPADVDGNGVVDVFDLLAVLANFGNTEPLDTTGDVTGPGPGDPPDGVVDVFDLLALLGDYGVVCP